MKIPVFSLVVLITATGFAQPAPTVTPGPPDPAASSDKRVVGHVFEPNQLPAPDVSRLRVPDGFRVEKFAEQLGNPRILAVSPAGRVYVTRRDQGDVLMLKVGANGLAEGQPVRVASRSGMHGITFYKQWVYLATPHEIFRATVNDDGTFGPLEMLIYNLPDAGQHHTRTVQIGPDDMMYIGVGSTTNEANETNPENATILRGSLDGKRRSVFASGLRDVVGWGWHPATGELWAMDHGIDWLGDDEQPEELNLIEKGKRYGWPYFYADNQMNSHIDPPGGLKKSEWLRSSVPMVLGYRAHSSPMQLSFYGGRQFPAEYRGDAFVSMRGSWNRKPPSGYEVVRIHFENGHPARFEPFVTGFVDDSGEYGRLCGNAVAPDGSLLFTDDRNGVIYRVSYTGGPTDAFVAQKIPAEPMRQQSHEGIKEAIASKMPDMHSGGKLDVTSPAFRHKGTIPVMLSNYDQNASIPLAWTAGPAGTRTYALFMEDPDASVTPLPVVHWIAWNIPADVLSLREGLQAMDRLQEPKGLRQGVNVNGTVGYTGPRPPEGEPAHHYQIQIFALDQELDLAPGAGRKELLAACSGHVLAAGVLEGKFARPKNPVKP